MKKVYLFIITALLLCSSDVLAVKKQIIYVRGTGNYNDSLTIATIASYAKGSVYNVTELKKSKLTQADLVQLNAADVVIMGRNLPSGDVGSSMGVWDSITKPVIALNMWGMRSTRAKWMNDASIATTTTNDTLKAVIKSTDEVMQGLTGTIDWWIGRRDLFSIKNAGNGVVLAQRADSVPLFIRWQAGTEFYTGAGHFPLGERVFIGCASDNSGGTPINYFGFTNSAKKVFFAELGRLAGVPIKVVYVRGTGNYNDSTLISKIAGYADSSMFKVTELKKSKLTQADLTQLNAADVVIMGRNLPSGDVGSSMGVWDSITKPVIALNMWGMRSTRAKWMNDGSIATTTTNDTLKAVIKSTDAVLQGLTGTVDWWVGRRDLFSIKNAGNGVVLAQRSDSVPLFIRWQAGTEFYTGAGHFPLGERVFIGCASDNSGGTPINYFGFTDAVKEVFFAELLKVGSTKQTVLPKRKITDLVTLTPSAGVLSPALANGTLKYTVTAPYGTNAVPTLTVVALDPSAKVVLKNATSYTDSATIKVTAEDTTVKVTYVIKFVLTPVNKDATLASMEIQFGELSPTFSKDVTNYTVKLAGSTTTFPTLRNVKASSTLSTVVIHDGTSFTDDATVTVTAQDGSVKVYKIDFVVPAGLDNKLLSDVKVYPSPATDYIRIANVQKAIVSIYSISGALINKINITDNSTISISNLESGTYLITITTENATVNTKFIKK